MNTNMVNVILIIIVSQLTLLINGSQSTSTSPPSTVASSKLVSAMRSTWAKITSRTTLNDVYKGNNQEKQFRHVLLNAPPTSMNYCDEPVCYKNEDNIDLGCFEPWPLTAYGSIDLYSVCPQQPSAVGTSFHIYNTMDPQAMTSSFNSINSSDKIVIFVPGYKNVYNDSRFISLKDELLSVIDVVIMVDFARGADPGIISKLTDFYNLHQAAANTQVVGRQLALLLKRLRDSGKVDYKNIHIISFSLGTQVAHFMGSYMLKKWGYQIGRITSLDPPGILIFGPGKRLGPSDALFVDVIHTTKFNAPWDFNRAGSGKVGLHQQLGHVDFYPNGGGEDDLEQPGCYGIDWCSHSYSIDLMKASIRKCYFQAVSCPSYKLFLNNACKREDNNFRLGYWSVQYSGRGRSYLTTSANPMENC